MRARAVRSWSPQSHRIDPNTSPVRHSECMRTSTGASWARSPSASARWLAPSSVFSYTTAVNSATRVGRRVTPSRRTKRSRARRYRIRSRTAISGSSCRAANAASSGNRAIVPSSLMISHSTPAGASPASDARSTAASVWPARRSPQREDVARTRQMLGPRGGIHERADGRGPIMGGDARGDLVPRADRHGERGPLVRRVVGHHLRQIQRLQPLRGERDGDEAARVPEHEVDRLGRDTLRRDAQVSLVFPILVVHDDDEPAVADSCNRLLHGRPYAGRRPGGAHVGRPSSAAPRGRVPAYAPASRSTYFAITSISRLTKVPAATRPSVVTAAVCGITDTPNRHAPTDATVRLTPSTAMAPFSTT